MRHISRMSKLKANLLSRTVILLTLLDNVFDFRPFVYRLVVEQFLHNTSTTFANYCSLSNKN
jgi:hypothetical protein